MKTLLQFLLAQGAAQAGTCAIADLVPYQSEKMAARMDSLPFAPQTALVGSFPFYSGDAEGNLAQFARVQDYHQAIFLRVQQAAAALSATYPQWQFYPLKNGWPLPIVQAARLSGVAMTGHHGLAIDRQYGSYISLSAVACDAPLPMDGDPPTVPLGSCEGCGACMAACPTGAAQWNGYQRLLDRSRCIAHITQNKGMSEQQLALLGLSPYVWGCDLCQVVCPHNQEAAVTPLPEFQSALCTLSEPQLLCRDTLADRHYAKQLPLLRRNLSYVKHDKPDFGQLPNNYR